MTDDPEEQIVYDLYLDGRQYHTWGTLDAGIDPVQYVKDNFHGTGFELHPSPWDRREAYRLAAGVYTPPVWRKEDFWLDAPEAVKRTFPHVSKVEPSMLAFTPDEKYGEAGRKVRTKPGRYLAKFFSDTLTKREIAYYAEWWAKGERPKDDTLAKLKVEFVGDPDSIADAYISGPSSCMDGDEFDDPACHPTRVYGAGDLALAVIRRPTDPDKPLNIGGPEGGVLARALVWPEKKVVGRVYPTVDRWEEDNFYSPADCERLVAHLEHTLREQGYRSVYKDGWTLFDGARLLKESTGRSCYVMPYLDGELGVKESDCGDFLVISRHDYDADCQTTSGYVHFTAKATCDHCDHCDRRVDEDDIITVQTVAPSEGSDSEFWCQNCVDADTFYCAATCEHYVEDVPHVTLHDGSVCLTEEFETNGYVCAFNGGKFLTAHSPQVTVEGETWSALNAERHAFTCAHDGLTYKVTSESVVYPGFAAIHDDNPDISPEDRAAAAYPAQVYIAFGTGRELEYTYAPQRLYPTTNDKARALVRPYREAVAIFRAEGIDRQGSALFEPGRHRFYLIDATQPAVQTDLPLEQPSEPNVLMSAEEVAQSRISANAIHGRFVDLSNRMVVSATYDPYSYAMNATPVRRQGT